MTKKSLFVALKERWQNWSWKQRALALLACFILFLLLLVGLFILFLFKGVEPFQPLPVAAGAHCDNFVIHSYKGIPLLWTNSVPYPTPHDGSNRPIQSLDGVWQMRLDPKGRGRLDKWFLEGQNETSKDWQDITIPSTYNAVEGKHPNHKGIVWFRRRFKVDIPSDTTRRLRLRFGAVLLRSTVYLDGRRIGHHEGGYTPFYFDITGLAPGSSHSLVVRADNRPTYHSIPCKLRTEDEPGWMVFGGISRSVEIESLPLRHTVKVALESKLADQKATLSAKILTYSPVDKQSYELRMTLRDRNGEVLAKRQQSCDKPGLVAVHEQDFEIVQPLLWEPGNSRLYTLEIQLSCAGALDKTYFETGIRSIAIDKEKILINGRDTFLNGIAKHEAHPTWGTTTPPKLLKRDFDLLQELGVNYVRLAHYPHSLQVLHEARDRGLMLCQEVPLYQAGMGWVPWLWKSRRLSNFPIEHFGARQLLHKTLQRNTQQQLIEMIERDRNNPAVIFWCVGNENFSLTAEARQVHEWFRDVVRAFDKTRPVTYAEFTYGIPTLDSMRQNSSVMDLVSINMYYGWYFGTPEQSGEYLDSVQQLWPNKPVMISECGAAAVLGRSDKDGVFDTGKMPYGRTYSEEYQVRVLETIFKETRQRSFMRGFSPWVFADFSCPWFQQNPIPGFNLKGVTTSKRKPKKAFFKLAELYED